MRIDVGGGTVTPDGWTNLDPAHGTPPWRRRAQDAPWPCPDGSVEAVRASHVLEHIEAGRPRLTVLNEAWRVLRPGGTLEVIVPLLVHDGRTNWQAVADPTHVSYWCRQSFDYLTAPIANADYDLRMWRLKSWRVVDGWEGHALLAKP